MTHGLKGLLPELSWTTSAIIKQSLDLTTLLPWSYLDLLEFTTKYTQVSKYNSGSYIAEWYMFNSQR